MIVWQTYLFDSVTGEARFVVATNGHWVSVVSVRADDEVADRLKKVLERRLATGVPVAQSPIDWVVDELPFVMPRREIFATPEEARTRAHEVLHDLGHVDGLDITTRLENEAVAVEPVLGRAVVLASIWGELIAVVLEDRDAQLRIVDMAEPDRDLHEWIRSIEHRPLSSSPEGGWQPDYTVQQVVVELTLGDNFRRPLKSDNAVEVVERLVGLAHVVLDGGEAVESTGVSVRPTARAEVVGTIFRYTITEKLHALFEVCEQAIGVTDEVRYSENQPDLRVDQLRSIRWDVTGSFEDAEDLCKWQFEMQHSWQQILDNGGSIEWEPHWLQPSPGFWVSSTYEHM